MKSRRERLTDWFSRRQSFRIACRDMTGMDINMHNLEGHNNSGMGVLAKTGVLFRRKLSRWPAVLLLLAAFLGTAYLGRDSLLMSRSYRLDSTSKVHFGVDGHLLLIDQGKEGLELLHGTDLLAEHWTGGSLNGFYYAELAAEGPDGVIFIVDRAYRKTEDGATETVERVLELQGRKCRTVWEAVPDVEEVFKAQTISIYDLLYYDGTVWFLRNEKDSLALYSFVPGGSASLSQRFYLRDTINDASYDAATNTIAAAARRGSVRVKPYGQADWITIPTDEQHRMPNTVTVRGGELYYSDAWSNRVYRYSVRNTQKAGEADTPENSQSVFFQSEGQIIALEASPDGSRVLASDGGGFFLVSEDGSAYIDAVNYARYPLTLLARASLAAAAMAVLLFLMRGLPLLRRLFQAESTLRILLVISVSVIVTALVTYSLMRELFTKEDEALVDNMKLFAEIMRDSIDTGDLKEIQWEGDYESAAYNRVREPLDQFLRLAYAENNYYYYILYRLDGNTMRLIMNADDYVMCGEPYEMGDQIYSAEVQRTGRAVSLLTNDTDGRWINVMIPVSDEQGVRIAVLEVGMDMGLRTHQRQAAVVNMVISVCCTAAVVVMLVLEGLFLLSFQERRQRRQAEGERLTGSELVPVRSLMCLSYLADSMQEPFIAVLCTRLYRGGLPLPDGVASALPMSGELLLMAVCSAFVGPLTERLGTRKLMAGGMAVQLLGCVCCFATGSFYGVFAGKLLIGAGMGTVYVSCNMVASAGETEDAAASGFAGISAGILSGMSIGAGLSSAFLSMEGWRLIYLVGAILLAAALGMAVLSGDVMPRKADFSENESMIGIVQFFASRRILGYFLLILVPFMMSLSYREYFFPIFAQNHGIDEVRVGQIYLLCGLLVLYFGPPLTEWMLKTLRPLWSVVAASVLMGVNMLVFVLHPTMGSVLLGVVLVYLVFSFSSGCQYTYFQNCPECIKFGEGKSMGIYSVFESLGQTLGPISYGALLGCGHRMGIGIFCTVMLALTLCFAALMWKQRKLFL